MPPPPLLKTPELCISQCLRSVVLVYSGIAIIIRLPIVRLTQPCRVIQIFTQPTPEKRPVRLFRRHGRNRSEFRVGIKGQMVRAGLLQTQPVTGSGRVPLGCRGVLIYKACHFSVETTHQMFSNHAIFALRHGLQCQ